MQRVVTWVVLVAYVAIAAGVPLPAGAIVDAAIPSVAAGLLAAKDRSRPFPCMNSPCGCATAEQCFRACCCHSVAERIAWARRHGLEAELLAAIETRMEPQGRRSSETAPSRCCSDAAATTSAGRAPDAARQASCCRAATADESRPVREAICTPGGEAHLTTREDRRGLPVVGSPEDDGLPSIVAVETSPRGMPRDEPQPRRVSLRAMLACQGVVAQWVSVGGSLPPARVEAASIAPPCGVVALLDAVAESPRPVPESPPPIAA